MLLAARASIALARTSEIHAQLQRLEELATPTKDGGFGWGLTFPFDAFADGSTNPTDTIYSYTTAHAGIAFLEAFEATGRHEYRDLASAALETLLDETCCWRDGDHLAVWYSDQPADQKEGYQVHNVNGLSQALAAGLLARGDNSDLEDVVAAITADLVAAQGRGVEPDPATGADDPSEANWRYARRDGTPNDLIHETFIVHGLLSVTDRGAREAALASLDGIWETHFAPTGCPRRDIHTQGSHGWGPPAGLFALLQAEEHRRHADLVAWCLLQKGPGPESVAAGAEDGNPRALGWYALGFAAYAAQSATVVPSQDH